MLDYFSGINIFQELIGPMKIVNRKAHHTKLYLQYMFTSWLKFYFTYTYMNASMLSCSVVSDCL